MIPAAPHETPRPGPTADLGQRIGARIPVIETGRLRLRAPRLEDFAAYAEIVLSPRGRHILTDRTRDAAWLDFAQMVATWILRGHGLWTVESREDRAIRVYRHRPPASVAAPTQYRRDTDAIPNHRKDRP